ncbi:hypothetical protein COP1_031116 [Malus domestica]
MDNVEHHQQKRIATEIDVNKFSNVFWLQMRRRVSWVAKRLMSERSCISRPFGSSKLRPIFDLLSNIHNLMPMKLDWVNFSDWRYQIDTILRAYDLIGYVDGSLKCPDKFIVQTSTTRKMVNPAYEIWCREDRAVMAGINTTLSTLVLREVEKCSTARQLWLVLANNWEI